MKKIIYLNDSIHGLISLSEYEKRIISSIGFNRLHDVYQNSTVYNCIVKISNWIFYSNTCTIAKFQII